MDEENFDKLKAAYDACIDEETIKNLGVKPLLDVLNEISKIYPTSGSTQADDDLALSETILYLAKAGVTALVSAGTGPDDTDPDTVVVSVSPPYRTGLPAKELYGDDKVVKKYEDALTQVISALYPDQKIDSHALVELEKKLAAASPDAEDRDDVTVT